MTEVLLKKYTKALEMDFLKKAKLRMAGFLKRAVTRVLEEHPELSSSNLDRHQK